MRCLLVVMLVSACVPTLVHVLAVVSRAGPSPRAEGCAFDGRDLAARQ